MNKEIIIIGAGGLGREILAILNHEAFSEFDVKGFCDDYITAGTIINGCAVLGNLEWLIQNKQGCGLILAVGNPQIRKIILQKLLGFDFYFPTVVHPEVTIYDFSRVIIGRGCVINYGCVLTTDIVIKDYCYLNTYCSLHHDAQVGEGSVLMPGVRITGGAKIGRYSYLSSNCAIETNCTIDENSYLTQSIFK